MIDRRWELLLLGWAVAAALLFALYLLQVRTKDATAVDAGWAASLVLLAVLYAVLAPGALCHRFLVAVLAGLEYLRIAFVVLRRIGGAEDSRYRELRSRWRARGREQLTFATFYQAQAALAALFSIPFLLTSFNENGSLEPLEWAGAGVWLAGALFEAVADFQLARFKADPANRGTTMRSGLWRYSRHPNYFGEMLVWWGLFLYAVPVLHGAAFAVVIGPVFITLLLLFVSGIPPLERSADEKYGSDAAYRDYKRRTSILVPLPPRG